MFLNDTVTRWVTWMTFPSVVRKSLRQRSGSCELAVDIALCGPRSRKLVCEYVKSDNVSRRITLDVIHLAIVGKRNSIPVNVVRKLISTDDIGTILLYEILLRYYDVYQSRLDDIIICAQTGGFNIDKQIEFVREARASCDDIVLIRTIIDQVIAREKPS